MNNISRKTAIVGLGETTYYKRAQSPDPEFKMALMAILAAVEDAGIKVTDIDGFSSYSDDRNSAVRLASALGIPELRFNSMVWGGGGGGCCAAIANAAAAVAAGYAETVVVFRALAQGQFGRFGGGSGAPVAAFPMSYTQPYGMLSPAQMFAMMARRFMHEHDVTQDALKAVSLAAYHHAQFNPRAVMHGRPLTPEGYDNSRWIVEPFHLFDCCLENDCAAAVIVTSAERARDMQQKPVYIQAAAQGSDYRHAAPAHNAPDYGTSNFKSLARNLYAMAGLDPKDVDVAQLYENFTGGVVMAYVEHGFCAPEEVNAQMTFENLRVESGRIPINTSGGNLAECYVHGFGLNIEAARQIRGTSTAQVKDAKVSLVAGGPMVSPLSNLILAA